MNLQLPVYGTRTQDGDEQTILMVVSHTDRSMAVPIFTTWHLANDYVNDLDKETKKHTSIVTLRTLHDIKDFLTSAYRIGARWLVFDPLDGTDLKIHGLAEIIDQLPNR